MNPVEMLSTSCQLLGEQVRAAGRVPDAPTSCSEWNAAQLVNHVVATLRTATRMVNGQPPEYDPTNPPVVVGDNPAADFEEAAAATIAAFSKPGAMERIVEGPAGPMPGHQFINFPLLDTFIHSWDLSQATGVTGDYPATIVAHLSAYAEMAFSAERPPPIGAAVPPPDNATPIEALVAFLGRTPRAE